MGDFLCPGTEAVPLAYLAEHSMGLIIAYACHWLLSTVPTEQYQSHPRGPMVGVISLLLRVTHIKNRAAEVHLPPQFSMWDWKSRIFFLPFHETFYRNSELLIHGNIQRWETFWTSPFMLIKTTASALHSVFQNNRSTDLLGEPMVSCFTTLFLRGDSVVYQLGNMWHAKIFYRQLLRNI